MSVVIANYFENKEVTASISFVVSDVLLDASENIELTYTVGQIVEGSAFGKSLFLHYTDTVTRGQLMDVMLPSLSDQLLEALKSGPTISVTDARRDLTITLEPEPYAEAISL